MNAVQIVTIKNKIPLFKGNDKAERIELIQLEENGFDLEYIILTHAHGDHIGALNDLKLKYNNARQAAITKELIEIVGGAEALNE